MFQKLSSITILGLCIVCYVQSSDGHLLVKRQALVDRFGNAASSAITGFTSDGSPINKLSNKKPSLKLPNTNVNQQLPTISANPNVDDDSLTLDDINNPEVSPESVDKLPVARPPSTRPQNPIVPERGPKRKPPTRPLPRPNNGPVNSASSFASSSPSNRRKPNRKSHDYDDDDEYDSYDGDYVSAHSDNDYGSEFMGHPMLQMKGIFAHILDNMPTGMTGGDYYSDDDNNNGNIAMASSYSSGDGYSRTRSTVNNNGRMRGIMSETRNGRTRTRRIGSGGNNEDEDY